MEKPQVAEHLGYLDGLRGLAAFLVVATHASLQVNENEPIRHLLQLNIYGRYAVDLFIVLSGFCLMLPIARGDGTLRGGALNFFRRRAWRILPTYYLALMLSAVLALSLIRYKTGTHWDWSIPVTKRSALTHLLLLQDACGDDYLINGVFWSIAVEWRIYFLFPLLVWAWRKIGGIKTTIIAVISSYVLFLVCSRFIQTGLTAYYIGLFAMGMLGASIVFSNDGTVFKMKTWPWMWLAAYATVGVVLISELKLWHGDILPYSLRDVLVGFWAMCLLVFVARSEAGIVSRTLNLKPFTILGTFAYSIYLIHQPFLQVLWQYVFTPLQEKPTLMILALLFLGSPLIVAISYLFFLTCEAPFLRKKAKISKKPDLTPVKVA